MTEIIDEQSADITEGLKKLRIGGIATLEECCCNTIIKYLKEKGLIFTGIKKIDVSDISYWIPMLDNLYNKEKVINLPAKKILKKTLYNYHKKLRTIPRLLENIREFKYCVTYQEQYKKAKTELLYIFKDYPLLLDVKIKDNNKYILCCLIRVNELELIGHLLGYQLLSHKFYLK
jgi:hypothetical protein